MGYTAKGNGYISFVSADAPALRQEFNDIGFEVENATADIIELSFYDKYHDDELYDLLNRVSSFGEIIGGCFEFVGEDDALWQIKYDPDTKEWNETNGTVTYSTTVDKDFTCKNCGQSLKSIADAIKAGARYCFNCGYRIDLPKTETATDKKKYVVVITETLQKRVTVEAEDAVEAEELAEANWNSAGYEGGDPEYVLTSEDFVEANFQAIEEIDGENRKAI